jgi:homoserine dehydrogenase
MARVLRVGMLGLGTVGSGVYRMLTENAEAVTARVSFPVEVVKVGVRQASKKRDVVPPGLTDDLASIVDDPSIDVVVEVIGGLEPARELVERALRSGKSVVTANKELIARDGSRLVGLARSLKLDLHFEAAVGGGIPLVQPIKHQLAGNDVVRLMGILNGTTNYILTRMARDGAAFGDVLAEAQAKGYAEADPTNDVDGFDTAYKLAILGSIAFGGQVPIEGVYREGIRDLKPAEMAYADLLGYRVKLLGIVEPVEGGVLARVHPALVPKAHPLASVEDVYNAVWLHGNFVGDVMFSGRGAGANPTASAVVGDLIDVGRNMAVSGPGSAIPYGPELLTQPIEGSVTPFYLRVRVKDQPRVLGQIANCFGDHDVSLAAMEMRVLDLPAGPDGSGFGEIVFLTHPCVEVNFRNAVDALVADRLIERLEAWLRVVE